MTYPSTVREIEDGLGALAAAHPGLCTRTELPNATHEGRRVSSVRMAGASGGRRVLFIGGAHAREWVPPDALLSLLARVLAAYESKQELEYRRSPTRRRRPTSPTRRRRSRPTRSSGSSTASSCS